MRGGNRGHEQVDEFAETMILVALCLMVSVLLYVRTRIVERIRREQQAAPAPNGEGQQQEQGPPRDQAIPPPGDAARDGFWGAII
jgi:SEL1 protein